MCLKGQVRAESPVQDQQWLPSNEHPDQVEAVFGAPDVLEQGSADVPPGLFEGWLVLPLVLVASHGTCLGAASLLLVDSHFPAGSVHARLSGPCLSRSPALSLVRKVLSSSLNRKSGWPKTGSQGLTS